jgi:ABC-2 type transport system permease protein
MRGLITGAGKLTLFMLKRERVNSSIWILLLTAFSVLLAAGMGDMFDEASRQALALSLDNPAMISMMGPIFGADNYTVGAMYGGLMLIWVIMAAGVMNIFLVVRHSRADEELGRMEVLRSLPLGRLAALKAVLAVALLVNIVLALFTGLGMYATGVESMDFAGCMLYGAALGAGGFFFAAVAAVFSQLCVSSRGALTGSFAVMGVMYVLRAIGDIGAEPLSYISTFGLLQRSQVFVENYWWPSLIVLFQTLVLGAVALALDNIRDLGQGFIAARPGRKHAPRWMRSSLGLAWRLKKNSIIAWFLIMFCLAAAYASVLEELESFIMENEFYQQIMGVTPDASLSEMIEGFVSMVHSIMALFALVPLLIAALKPRAEEKENRAEHVLARVVSRTKYLAGYVFIAFAASVVLQFATAAGLYSGAAAVLAEPIPFTFLIRANFGYLPAMWVMIGLTVFLVGLLPKATAFIWAAYGYSFFIFFVGRMLDIPAFLKNIVPYVHVTQLYRASEQLEFMPMAVMTGIALVLTAAGFVFFHKRDTVTAA